MPMEELNAYVKERAFILIANQSQPVTLSVMKKENILSIQLVHVYAFVKIKLQNILNAENPAWVTVKVASVIMGYVNALILKGTFLGVMRTITK